jgi:hypothetical protein
LDVHRKADRDAYPETIPGESWLNLEQIDVLSQEVSQGKRGVIYGIG